MREIKFRAWDTARDIMFDPFTMFNLLKRQVRIIAEDYESGRYKIMQYTGLKDKNGKEIYEGDILVIIDTYTEPILEDGSGPTHSFHHLAPVIFKMGEFGVNIQTSGNLWSKNFVSFGCLVSEGYFDPNEIEIIGNIYENPELLESKNE